MNVMERRNRPAPPKSTARKSSPVNAEFEEKAKDLLRHAIAERGVTIEVLAERLGKIGVDMSRGGVANKISRGGFSSAFLLQCMEALDIDLKAVKR